MVGEEDFAPAQMIFFLILVFSLFLLSPSSSQGYHFPACFLDLRHFSALSRPPPLLHRLSISLFSRCASEVGSKTVDLKIGRVGGPDRSSASTSPHQLRSILRWFVRDVTWVALVRSSFDESGYFWSPPEHWFVRSKDGIWVSTPPADR
ncbi:hypothetical protein RHMOL_Rhmol06G0075400 [Rhododendron molle]|uniref:Uncharacterized protein n=1 Tax=Rhododendron molle TaxID=49168 RepID=A0ACC0NA33_RHOML|nr:hypothetical protein RHMOL_Rhmol06G0075400 [Rhododendron molle]